MDLDTHHVLLDLRQQPVEKVASMLIVSKKLHNTEEQLADSALPGICHSCIMELKYSLQRVLYLFSGDYQQLLISLHIMNAAP